MTNWRKAGLLYGVTPPSWNRNVWLPNVAVSGGKNVGAAVLARTTCQSGRSRLQSGRDRSLYLPFEQFESGHGESVDAFCRTQRSSVRKRSPPNVVSGP